jgi:hypothetical protein
MVTFEQLVSPAPRDVWSAVVATDPDATLQQTPAWFDAMVRYTGAEDISRLYVMRDGRRVILPLTRRRPVPGMALDEYCSPGSGDWGLVASGGMQAEDVRVVLTDLTRTDAIRTQLQAAAHTASRWEAGLVPPFTSTRIPVEVLDLDGGFERVWDTRFHSSARSAVRKAQRSGVVVERDDTVRLVPELYELYLRWTDQRAERSGLPRVLARRLARRREPLRMLEAVLGLPGDGSRLWLARHEGVAVAALITLVHGQHAAFYRGWSDLALGGPVRANNLLQRLAIEDACQAGCRYYSLGYSGGVASLERFKRTMGSAPHYVLHCALERIPLSRLKRLRARAEADAARLLRHRPGAASPGTS